MTTNDDLFDKAISHQIGLLRFSNSLTREIIKLLNETEEDLITKILKTDGATKEQLEKLLLEIKELNAQVFSSAGQHLRKELVEFSVYESTYQIAAVSTAVGVQMNKPNIAQLKAVVSDTPFQGRYLKEWLKGMEEARYRRVRDQIRIGYIEGESISSIVRRVKGTRRAKYKDGVLEVSRRDAETIVRTAVNHIATTASEITYKENIELFKGVQWVSILDGKTTHICASRDGNIYEIGVGPRTPAHPRCRSIMVPVLKGVPMPKRLNYGPWLRKQPVSFQDDVLGVTKGRLFRKGGLSIDKFVDDRGKVLTLTQLADRESKAFASAGITRG